MLVEKNGFIHHVFFWLKNSDSKQDLDQLIDGLKKLSKVPTISNFHIGIPANTNRSVIDSSYTVSWLLFFETANDHDIYQTHPIHLKFVDECAHLWSKLIIYDTVSFGD